MVLSCPRDDRCSRQLIAFSFERRPRLGQTPRRCHDHRSRVSYLGEQARGEMDG